MHYVSNSNMYFYADSFIIMKPLNQNEDPKIVIDMISCFLYQKNAAFVTGMDQKRPHL